jgi:hypothetical protein
MTATPGERTTTGWVPVLDDSTFGARLVLIRYKKRWPGHKRAAEETGFRTATWPSYLTPVTSQTPIGPSQTRQTGIQAVLLGRPDDPRPIKPH